MSIRICFKFMKCLRNKPVGTNVRRTFHVIPTSQGCQQYTVRKEPAGAHVLVMKQGRAARACLQCLCLSVFDPGQKRTTCWNRPGVILIGDVEQCFVIPGREGVLGME